MPSRSCGRSIDDHDAFALARAILANAGANGGDRLPGTGGYGGPVVGANLFPVSVKGVVVQRGRVLLLRNERAEWELPGGKLELGEDPPACVAREIAEETGWRVTVGPVLDCWQYHIGNHQDVVIVTYGCHVATDYPPLVSSEHSRAGLFSPAEVPQLPMPSGYKRSVTTWLGLIADGE